MANTYVTALIDSLSQKVDVLKEIRQKNAEQLELTKDTPFPFEKFDKICEDKKVLIYKVNKLDEGFELVYDEIRSELAGNRELYKEEIAKLQKLITEVTDLGTTIQAEEARNKNAMEAALRSERSKLKQGRSSVKAVQSYSQTMKNSYVATFGDIMDQKK